MEDLTRYDIKPEAFINYLRYYGEHFNKKLCEFACKLLKTHEYTKEKVEAMLKLYDVLIKEPKLHDLVYIANWCKSILYGSSIINEKHIALFIKDVYEKDGHHIFNRWYADMAKDGEPIEWEEMI